ncbi:MAG: hypothetical protein RLZZ444_2236 [Pseudomonadota bacterium]|jgi:hypothetical protein
MTMLRRVLPLALLTLIAVQAKAWDGLFVPTSDYTDETPMPTTMPSAALLQDGRVAIANGDSIHLFDPAHSTLTRAVTLPVWLPGARFVPLPNGKALLIGDYYTMNRGIVFDSANNSVVQTPDLSAPRVWSSVTRLASGKVMLAGGCATNTCATPLATTDIFDPASGTFSPGPNMLQRRVYHSATLLADGRVLFYGGQGYAASAADGGGLHALDTAEIYDPATNSFAYARDQSGNQTHMWWSRSYHTGSALTNGDALLCGGRQIGTADYGPAYSCDIFVATTGEIHSSPPVPGDSYRQDILPYGSGAMDHAATALADGTLLIAGGTGGIWPVPQAGAFVYSPATRAFHAVADMAHARRDAASVRLLDGSVLMIGGQTTPTSPDPSLPYSNYPWTPTMERYLPEVIFKDGFEH